MVKKKKSNYYSQRWKAELNIKCSIAIPYKSVLKSKWDCGIKKKKLGRFCMSNQRKNGTGKAMQMEEA